MAKDEDKPAAAADAKPAATPNKADAGDAAAAFAKANADWKTLLGELGALQGKYRQADAQEKAAIAKQWDELMKKADAQQRELQAAAEKAYAAAPNADKQIVDLLLEIVRSCVLRNDDYESGLQVAKLLLDNKCGEKTLPNLAGIAAFQADQFDDAEQYFAQARKLSALDMAGSELAGEVAEYKKLWAKEKAVRDAEAKADDLPRVLLKTTKGDIEIELYENEAPNTVANFISLVEKKFYDGVVFHRVLPGFMAQGGDPTGTGSGGPGYQIKCECYKPDYRRHFRGTLSMAHAGRDTGGSQFFLTFRPTSHLDGKHTAFGRVIKGLDVLAKLQRRDPERPPLPQPDKIIKAEVVRKRDHKYEPQTIKEFEP